MSPSPLPVAIWLRVSTQDQADGDSPEHHRLRAQAYADAKGWKVVEVYDLSGVSGKSVMASPLAKKMMSDVRSGKVKALIFSKIARLARNTKELLDFADFFRAENASLVSLTESIDTSTPSGRLFYTMLSAMASWEREEIADRVAQSVPIRASLGKPMGGATTFGYAWTDGKLVPDSKEAPIRALIYELFAEHKRKKTVARILNDRGYRTRNGSKFSDTTIERLLIDATAKGIRKTNYTKNGGQGKAAVLKPASSWVMHEVKPIVSDELWNACQDILNSQKAIKRPARRSVQLFGGKALCLCGGKMYVKTGSPKYTCQVCKNKVGIDDLEHIFSAELNRFVFSDEELNTYLDKGSEEIRNKASQVEVLEAELRKLKAEMEKLYLLYQEGALSIPLFKQRNTILEERVSQIESSLPKLQAQADLARIDQSSRDEVIQQARNLQDKWKIMPFEDKRQIVETIVDKITIGDNEIDISLHYLPHNEGNKATNDHGFMAATNWKRAGKVTW
jgi:site-specific DNA recombinase